MCTLSTRNSSGLLAPGDILKNPQKYVIERHFFFKLTTRRKIGKIQFPWVSHSRFSIFLQNVLSVVYRAICYSSVSIEFGSKYDPVSQTLLIRLHNRCLCIRHRAFLYTGPVLQGHPTRQSAVKLQPMQIAFWGLICAGLTRPLSLKLELSLQVKLIRIKFLRKDNLNYKLNTLGPWCLWQCLRQL